MSVIVTDSNICTDFRNVYIYRRAEYGGYDEAGQLVWLRGLKPWEFPTTQMIKAFRLVQPAINKLVVKKKKKKNLSFSHFCTVLPRHHRQHLTSPFPLLGHAKDRQTNRDHLIKMFDFGCPICSDWVKAQDRGSVLFNPLKMCYM